MENSITLQWKEFNVPVERLTITLKSLLGSNYDGIVCETKSFNVMFKEMPLEDEINTLNNYWNGVTQTQFSPTLREIIASKINEASCFGRALILDAAVENVELGITQAGKTRAVANYCSNIQRYLESGSLYAAIEELNRLILEVPPTELSPFITVDRLNEYKSKIVTFLSS